MLGQETFQNKSRLITRRMFTLSILKAVVFVSIISRLFYLQISENIKYRSLSDKNRLREWKIAPVRGKFEDFFGNTIAGNFESYQLHIIPEQVENFRYAINRVKDILELSDKQFKKIIKMAGSARKEVKI